MYKIYGKPPASPILVMRAGPIFEAHMLGGLGSLQIISEGSRLMDASQDLQKAKRELLVDQHLRTLLSLL